MKKAIYSFLLIILVIGGCVIDSDPPGQPQAPSILGTNITIGECSQEKIAFVDAYFFVYIKYKIENTGSVEISSYEIRFEATDYDGIYYYGEGFGIHLKPGETFSDEGFINMGWEKAKTVHYINYQLKHLSTDLGEITKESIDFDRSLNIVRK